MPSEGHRLVRLLFEYAKVPWVECGPDVYLAEMPKLMYFILEASSKDWTSASSVYYTLRDSKEETALDLVEGKREKIKTLSNLMMTMRFNGILEVKTVIEEGNEWAEFKATSCFTIADEAA